MPDSARALSYDLGTNRLLSFHEARERFLAGTQTPRQYLESCIETIERLEPHVGAFVTTNLDAARAAADEATARYARGAPLSLVDGLPIGIKDLFSPRPTCSRPSPEKTPPCPAAT